MSITSTLFPSTNRVAAFVAFYRTFWQVIRSSSWLGGGTALGLTVTDLLHINLQLLGLAAAAILINAVGSGLLAAGDILKNGLPDAYTSAAATSSGVVTNFVYNPPVQAPADPSQPAAGTPPSFQDLINPSASAPVAPAVVAAPVVTPAPAAPFVATSDALPPVNA